LEGEMTSLFDKAYARKDHDGIINGTGALKGVLTETIP